MVEKEPRVEQLAILANCSTILNAISYSSRVKLLAQASSNQILIQENLERENKEIVPRILFTLKSKACQGRINGVQFVEKQNGQTYLVAIASDSALIIWEVPEDINEEWPNLVIPKVTSDTLNYLQAYTIEDEIYIATSGTNGQVCIFMGKELGDISQKDELHFGKNVQECMEFTKLSEKSLLFCIAGYDMAIHCYVIPRLQHIPVERQMSETFHYVCSLNGHENALRDLAFTSDSTLLASASQDNTIRLWRLSSVQKEENASNSYQTKTSFLFTDPLTSQVHNLKLESVLQGHTEAISSLQWSPCNKELLSASFDFTVQVWHMDEQTGLWMQKSTLGAMLGNKHAFFGATFLSNTSNILSYTYNGALNQWRKKEEEGEWESVLTVKGHFNEVTDLDWSSKGDYLVTCSLDQTTRIVKEYSKGSWFEIARPQVHGYDINCLQLYRNFNQSEEGPRMADQILSGGDEKVLRNFDPAYSFIKTFNSCKKADEEELRFKNEVTNEMIEIKLKGSGEAAKQPLGLMNKPINVKEEDFDMLNTEYDPTTFLSNKQTDTVEEIVEPPVEDTLLSRTLWPERSKLYGHTHEVFCVATGNSLHIAASACKAKEKKDAAVIIWDLQKANILSKIQAHTLTVVQLEFSKDDKFLLSCSRDRSFAIYKKEEESNQYSLFLFKKEVHSRIIWSISWNIDDTIFATASRENKKSVKIWHGKGDKMGELHSDLSPDVPNVTALTFLPTSLGTYLLTGQETGDLKLWQLKEETKWILLKIFDDRCCPNQAVKRLKIVATKEEGNSFRVAVASSDWTTRILQLSL